MPNSQLPRNQTPFCAWSQSLKTGSLLGIKLAVAASVAHVGIAISNDWLASGPLTAALVGTLLFALTELSFRGFTEAHALSAEWRILTTIVSFGTAFAGFLTALWLLGLLVGDVHSFYCEPAIPWHFEVAVFGGFTSALFLKMTSGMRLEGILGPAVYLALFWISPFYGFFKAPVFLALGLLVECENRTAITITTAAVGMAVGAYTGRLLASWFQKKSG